MFDMDGAFRRNNSSTDYLAIATDPSLTWDTFLLRSFLENESFKYGFINRFADQLNTAFLPERTIAIITGNQNSIAPEMPEHIQRWSAPSSINSWNSAITDMINFANSRVDFQREHIRSKFGILGQFKLTINVDDEIQGYIKVNTINIKSTTIGVSENPYPWNGIYFDNIPITIEAISLPGFRFLKWVELPAGTPAKITLTLNTDATYTAVFEPDVQEQLVHYWNFNNLPSGTLTDVLPDYSILVGASITYPGSGGIMDRVIPGSDINAQPEIIDVYGLRTRNPAIDRELLIKLPTTGFENVFLSYAVTKSSATNGSQKHLIFYQTSPAEAWTQYGDTITIRAVEPTYQLVNLDFSSITGANNNPNFEVKVKFYNPGNVTSSSGNNRFDNITLDGTNIPLPVELTNFSSLVKNGKVMLNWETATEVNNFGFEIERKTGEDQYLKIGYVKGNGNSNSLKQYSFTDNKLIDGNTFKYRLKQLDNDGTFEYSKVLEVKIVPEKFTLEQNYPNPFNPSTTISYSVPFKEMVSLKIYDILGNEIRTLVNEEKEPGKYHLQFDASKLSSGVYFYHIKAGPFIETKKMILLQ